MKTLLLVLVAGLAVLALNFCSSAEAAPKYVATLTTPGPDAGATSNVGCVGNVNQTIELQAKIMLDGGATGPVPYCFKTCTTSTCVPNCTTDPMAPNSTGAGPSTTTGATGVATIAVTTAPIQLGLDKCVAVKAADGGTLTVNLYRDDSNP